MRAVTVSLRTATLVSTALVTPEQSAPMMAATLSELTCWVAVALAAAASMQVESPRTVFSVMPPGSRPLSEASLKASSALAAMPGGIDSSGPVKPRMMSKPSAKIAQITILVASAS